MRPFTKTLTAALAVAGLSFPAVAQTAWDMPTPYGDKNFHTANIRAFADDVHAATDGDLVITVHSAGSLVKHPEIASSVRRGLVPIGEFLMSRLGNEHPIYEVDSVPFLATNYDEAWKLWQASKPISTPPHTNRTIARWNNQGISDCPVITTMPSAETPTPNQSFALFTAHAAHRTRSGTALRSSGRALGRCSPKRRHHLGREPPELLQHH